MADPGISSSSPQMPGLNSYPPPPFSPFVAPNSTTNYAVPAAALGISSLLIILCCVAAMWCRQRQFPRHPRSLPNGIHPTFRGSITRRTSIDREGVPLEQINVEGYFRGGSKDFGKRMGVMPVSLPGESDTHMLALEDKGMTRQEALSRQSRSLSVLTDDSTTDRSHSVSTIGDDSLQKSDSILEEIPL